jgi:hypothetical protein
VLARIRVPKEKGFQNRLARGMLFHWNTLSLWFAAAAAAVVAVVAVAAVAL